MTGNGSQGDQDFPTRLRAIMASWGWTAPMIEAVFPRLLRIFQDVGILRPRADGGYETTDLAGDAAAWELAWERAEGEGIAGPSGDA